MRYKVWRSRKDSSGHILCAEGSEAFGTGGPEGEVAKLRLPYRILLNEQKFVVIRVHVSQLELEGTRAQELHPANTQGQG